MNEAFEGKKSKMSNGSKKSLSGGEKSEGKEFKKEKLNESSKEEGSTQEREKRKSKSSSSGLKQDNIDGKMVNKVSESKKIDMHNGSQKTLSAAEENEETKDNKSVKENIKGKGDKHQKRRSTLSSKGLNQKDEIDGAMIDDVFVEKDLDTSRNFNKSFCKTEESKKNKEKILHQGTEENNKEVKEKRKSKSSSSGLKQKDNGQILTDVSNKNELGSGNKSKENVKQKKAETKESESSEIKGPAMTMKSRDEDDFKGNPKERRKSKSKSTGLKQKGSESANIFKEGTGDQHFLEVHTEGKRKKSTVEDTVETNGLKNFKKEPVDQDFVNTHKKGKRKRSLAEDAEQALGVVEKKKIKVEKSELEIHLKKEKSSEEITHTKKKEKSGSDVKPKKEKNEGNQETKKKRTKEEKDAIADLKAKKKEEEEKLQWRWWEEQKYEDGVKWMFLEHKGPVFAPPYEPLPDTVKFYYDGKPLQLSSAAEEVASFFTKMLDHEYTIKEVFRKNFFMDWRKEMTLEEKTVIVDLDKCDFTEMFTYYKGKMEEKKNITKEEKLVNKEVNEKIVQEFGFCVMDQHRERIGNFKIEPPGLFRGRGDHPKQGMLKKRILPEDVIINCSKDSRIPEPPEGHKWKEIRHDNTVTWLASWTENVQGSIKYVMLNANSKLKGEKDWEKYEIARKLKVCVDRIRAQYREDWKSKEMKLRQRAVALYFIDKLALRAGNEKEEGETADTVGCCSLRVEHIKLYPELDGEKHVVEFDFLGKDSIRYYNKVPVKKQVFKNLQLFMENKQEGDDLFDRLNTPMLNKHLQSLMEGLTAKVFRTYNASITLQEQLKGLTDPDEPIPSKILSYNRANRAVAILCNHQRAPPKTFEQSMANLQAKIEAKKEQISLVKTELKQAKEDAKNSESDKLQKVLESKKKALERAKDQLMKLEVQATDREENKQIALSTSKLNYLDPRISVTWCQKWGVGLEKIYNKTQRDKFAWAINMSDVNFEF
ncbi:DNA topoisomerase I, mitochondrial-like isoform X2 [Pleurodeles waltl]|uniref:DNA topoisomerase I, mitochondrial-like isoform X2 n=1 Tax=Pleurodeles waltl TaxID=8319 RepID=UPI00370994BB